MANLIVDIGNTALKAAWSEGTTLGKTFRYQGERVIDFLKTLTSKNKPEVMIVATVREFSDYQTETLKKECDKLILLGSGPNKILEENGIPAYLSPDRAASIVAVRHLFKGQSCTIFDFGTTLAIDFVNSDGKYEGGNISPGCRTRFKAINRYSKTLPLLDTPDTIEEKGSSVASSIMTGIIKGIMFEISGYLQENPGNVMVFTGGDAIYFAKRMKKAIFVVCNLVLMGLALMADENEKRVS